MRNLVNFCEYFVICSGSSDRQVRAIADFIDTELSDLGMKMRFKEGLKKSDWIVFDAGDVITHIFQKQMREFYRLEYLWQDAKHVTWPDKKSVNAAKRKAST